jgi:hypothetical protein
LLDEVPAQTLDPVDRARLLTLAGRRDEAAAGWAQIMESPAPPFFAEYDPLYRVGGEGP